MAELHIVFPATDESALSSMLRQITKAIEDGRYGGPDGYGLGGEYGYGADWDSEVFQLRRYCWCDGDDCPWCSYSSEDGRRLTEAAKAHGAISDLHGCGGAPNFWHKPSGLRVWWYKYIGRGMEVYGDADLAIIGAECLADVARLSTPEGER